MRWLFFLIIVSVVLADCNDLEYVYTNYQQSFASKESHSDCLSGNHRLLISLPYDRSSCEVYPTIEPGTHLLTYGINYCDDDCNDTYNFSKNIYTGSDTFYIYSDAHLVEMASSSPFSITIYCNQEYDPPRRSSSSSIYIFLVLLVVFLFFVFTVVCFVCCKNKKSIEMKQDISDSEQNEQPILQPPPQMKVENQQPIKQTQSLIQPMYVLVQQPSQVPNQPQLMYAGQQMQKLPQIQMQPQPNQPSYIIQSQPSQQQRIQQPIYVAVQPQQMHNQPPPQMKVENQHQQPIKQTQPLTQPMYVLVQQPSQVPNQPQLMYAGQPQMQMQPQPNQPSCIIQSQPFQQPIYAAVPPQQEQSDNVYPKFD